MSWKKGKLPDLGRVALGAALVIGVGLWLWGRATGATEIDPAASPIPWRTDLDAALAEARRDEKPVIVDFYADWCPPCREMERTTFADERVQKRLEKLIPVKIDVDAQHRIARRHNVRVLPTSLVIAPNGEVLARRPGYSGVEAYLDFLPPPPREKPEPGSLGREPG